MSFAWQEQTWEIAEELGLRPSARLVLLCLAQHADPRGRCWPAMARIRARTGLDERTTRKVLAELEAAGAVIVERRAGRPSMYFLSPPANVQGGQKCTPYKNAGGGKNVPPPKMQGDPPQKCPPNQSRNKSENKSHTPRAGARGENVCVDDVAAIPDEVAELFARRLRAGGVGDAGALLAALLRRAKGREVGLVGPRQVEAARRQGEALLAGEAGARPGGRRQQALMADLAGFLRMARGEDPLTSHDPAARRSAAWAGLRVLEQMGREGLGEIRGELERIAEQPERLH